MMWLLPAAVVLFAGIPVAIMVRRLAAETLEFRRELQRFSALRPALVELRSDTRAFRAGVVHRTTQLPRR